MPSTTNLFLADTSADGIVSIDFAAPGCRVRKIISRSNMKPTGRYPSFRLRRALAWDSAAELNLFRLLDCNPAVLSFAEQPCTIHYRLGGVEHRHVPDSIVRADSAQPAFWEVKTAADARRPEIADRTLLLTEHCPLHGYQYSVVLAEDLRREPRLRNARLLLRYGRNALTFEQREYFRRLLVANVPLAWDDVEAERLAPFSFRQACRLVLEGQLSINIDQPLSGQLLMPVVTHELLKVPNG